MKTYRSLHAISAAALILSGCGDSSETTASPLPQLTAAKSGTRTSCADLSTQFKYAKTSITSATVVDATSTDPEYCLVVGKMNERTSTVDQASYAIGFQMRLPKNWNGRFLYQANGGTDGSVAAATGAFGAPAVNGLQQGFAVISSDAGHSGLSAAFGLDPQARLDYGYQAVASLTPMAKALITSAYGRGPDRSYFGGGSNGGRHAMVAAARYADDYDGILAIAPGFNLPRAAVAQIWGAQQWASVATDLTVPTTNTNGLNTALTADERNLIASKILEKCDALDGVTDGLVQDTFGCQTKFSVRADVPTCTSTRTGACLSLAQKNVISTVFAGARKTNGEAIYASWPFDPGIRQQGWADWKFKFSVNNQRDAVAYGYIFATPPNPPGADTLAYALNLDIDAAASAIYATSGIYTESSMSFMSPPNPTQLDKLRNRGAKMIVIHGASDGVFSPQDTADWYKALNQQYAAEAGQFARYFIVPGMGHVRGGPATDRYDALTALVNWVENGQAPDRIVATTRSDNTDIPTDWPSTRARPLCPYPSKAIYTSGDKELADSYRCVQ